MQALYQCAANFSEGRDSAVIEAIAKAARGAPGATLIDYSADVDHNRCVMTILGSGGAIEAAVLDAARVAVGAIDLRRHTGLHPRIGALDVVPVVPLAGANRRDAAEVAEAIGRRLSNELDLPVYFYEDNARAGRARTLPALRRGGFEALLAGELTGTRAPDVGPNRAHPTAGAAVVGARGPLVAYNVNLATEDVEVARSIAARIRRRRERDPALQGIRALGLYLASRSLAQVSMNLTHPALTPIPAVFAFIANEAAREGISWLESEIIGAIPASSLAGASPESIHWRGYRADQILDPWLLRLRPPGKRRGPTLGRFSREGA